MAKIRHLAIVSTDPGKLADFYRDVFEMEVLHRAGNGSVFMTDGYINLAIVLNKAEGKPSGLNHFGFHVDDTAAIAERLADAGVAPPAKRPADRHYAQHRAFDLDGNNFDLSENGFETVRPEREPGAKEKTPA
jgi:catechol 2,3-dioxygenase-like lactoylglutathione lyase family enzyme